MRVLILLFTLCISFYLKAEESLTEKLALELAKPGDIENVDRQIRKLEETLRKEFNLPVSTELSFESAGFVGRSLESPYNGANFPRKIYSVGFDDRNSRVNFGSVVLPVFFAYTSGLQQIEILGLNSDGKSFDGKIVGGVGPKKVSYVEEAGDSICESCHQNKKAPILSAFPWSESEKEGLKEKFNFGGNEELKSFYGEVQAGRLFSIDLGIRQTNLNIKLKGVCDDVCRDGDIECKKSLAAISFLPSNDSQRDLLAKKLSKDFSWPDHGYAHVTSIIPDRDPETNIVKLHYPDYNATRTSNFFGKNTFLKIDKLDINNSKLSDLEKGSFLPFNMNDAVNNLNVNTFNRSTSQNDIVIYGLQNKTFPDGRVFHNPGNPTTARPKVVKLDPELFVEALASYGAQACFGVYSRQNLENYPELMKFIFDSQEFSEFVGKNDSIKLGKNIDSLYSKFAQNTSQGSVCSNCSMEQLSPFIKEGEAAKQVQQVLSAREDKPAISAEEVKNLFVGFCGRCHLQEAKSPLPLPLHNQQDLQKYEMLFKNFDLDGTGVPGRISRFEMPPQTSPEAQAMKFSGEETEIRRKMIEYLGVKEK